MIIRRPAGCSYSTELPEIDFETYSEAGYYFDAAANRWRSIVSSAPHGLGAVGAWVYSEHPSTEILSVAYNLKDGTGDQLWIPGRPEPRDLFTHVTNGRLLEAWNSFFEFAIWLNVGHNRMGWPNLPLHQLRDAMAKARAHGLPGKLENAGPAIGAPIEKIAEGKRLITKFSKPRTPTKKDPRRRIRPQEEPEDAAAFYRYNIGDIQAEGAVSALCPDLSALELDVWLMDQRINARGIGVDVGGLADCTEVVRQAMAQGAAKLPGLTGGSVTEPTEVQKIRTWVESRGILAPTLDKNDVAELLGRDDIPPDVRQVLDIRASLGAASVKKLGAMGRRMAQDGRIRDLFMYAGAERTGRWAGRGVQPQNLPGGGPDVRRCRCGRHYGADRKTCPWCAAPAAAGQSTEWCLEAVEDTLYAISSRSALCVEYFMGDAVAAVSGCLRGLLCSAPGYELISSDYSAIEAVVLAALAGEEWRLEVFRTHGKIYEMSAAKITGIPFEEIMAHAGYHDLTIPNWWEAEQTGEHHPTRKKIGKVAELACFTRETRLLTDKGYVSIEEVTRGHLLWDGVEWVEHDGVVARGRRAVIDLDGVGVTPEHPVSLNDSWKAAEQLVSDRSTLRRALAIGSENLPSSASRGIKPPGGRPSNVRADGPSISSPCQISIWGRLRGAAVAAVNALRKHTSKNTQNTPMLFPTPNIEGGWSIASGPQSPAATARTQVDTQTTEAAGLRCATNGAGLRAPAFFYSTLSLLKGGTCRVLRWIGLTRVPDTNPEISDSSPDRKTLKTNVKLGTCKPRSTAFANVYDIVNAGPRNRFMIKTDSGHLIVHNSGYRGSVGAWKKFGADKFFQNDDQILAAVRRWRAGNPMIKKFWYKLQDAATAAIRNPGTECAYRDITYGVRDDVLYCRLPSGRLLAYHQPRMLPDDRYNRDKITFMGWHSSIRQWIRIDTYGGKLTENVVQATSRDILAPAMLQLEAAGYPIVMHVHDEPVSEIPAGFGSVQEYEQIMCERPTWAADWPIRAGGGWRGRRYRKD